MDIDYSEEVRVRKKGCCACFTCPSKLKRKMSSLESKSKESVLPNSKSFRSRAAALHLVYTDRVPKLLPGTCITIKGTVQAKCLRFSLNLVCERDILSNIAFHFNPRLDQRYVVRNCSIAGEWGEEETTSVAKFNFVQGKDFTIDILLCLDKFLVAVDGYHFCAFGYRLPLKEIKEIDIHGRVDIADVTYRPVSIYPEMAQNVDALTKIPVYNFSHEVIDDEDRRLPMPFMGTLPSGMKTGWELEIHGRIKVMPHSFYINLQNGPQIFPHPDIPVHLNPRFSSAIGANSFIRNCWFGGKWQNEERCPSFPFEPGSTFLLCIKREMDFMFTLWVNNQLTGEFDPEAPSDVVDSSNIIYIQGDIVLTNVFLRTKDSVSPAVLSKASKLISSQVSFATINK